LTDLLVRKQFGSLLQKEETDKSLENKKTKVFSQKSKVITRPVKGEQQQVKH
jgi:hypothetical protein